MIVININRLVELLAVAVDCKSCPLNDECKVYNVWRCTGNCEEMIKEWLESEED